jgi:hypothetical protein
MIELGNAIGMLTFSSRKLQAAAQALGEAWHAIGRREYNLADVLLRDAREIIAEAEGVAPTSRLTDELGKVSDFLAAVREANDEA